MPIIAVQVPKNHDPAASAIDETAMTSHEFNGDTCRLPVKKSVQASPAFHGSTPPRAFGDDTFKYHQSGYL